MTKHDDGRRPDLLQGTLDLLILQALAAGELHGWAISRRILVLSREMLSVNQGSLYPALYRLEDRGWIAGAEATSPEGRRIRTYRLTAAGKKQLEREVEGWRAFRTAMGHVLGTR
jgi:PadR family transcriptional regulator PadR